MSSRLRDLPKIDEVLRRPEIASLDVPRWALKEAVRALVDERRRAIQAGAASASSDVGSDEVAARARELARPSLRRVINATGVVLHTNLGRAPLAEEAARRVLEVAVGYSNLEYDVGERARGSRHDHLQALLADLTAAEASIAVNNNAAAVLLCLAAIAEGRQVVVSRGELIEIGGSFRIPDVMRASGAHLVEVGTTNKTHLRDYAEAIGPETALLLKVHRSNFALTGFVAEVPLEELVSLGRARGVAVMIDLGSGTFIDPAALPGAGLAHEPTVPAAVAAGADLVTFSGDKLLGGPQAGIVAGRAAVLDKVRRHPLMRALRPDKMTLAALEATLELYRAGRAVERVPALALLGATPADLRARAERFLADAGPLALEACVVEVTSAVGGGALPTSSPPSYALAISDPARSAEALEAALRAGDPPVVGRIEDDRLLLDLRTVLDADLEALRRRLRELEPKEP